MKQLMKSVVWNLCVCLPIVTVTRNASNSPMPKSMCHRIIELPTGTDIHTRRSRPQMFGGAVFFRIEDRLCAGKSKIVVCL